MIDRAAFAKDRVVRVFVSSTFADMHPERDELVKRVFPQLRRMCVERGVSWSDVDLRWGSRKSSPNVAKSCRYAWPKSSGARPYFIGLLGERY